MTDVSEASLPRRLDERGYLVVEDVLDPERDLRPLLAEYAAVLDRVAGELHAQGRVASTYEELPFGRRLIRLTRESGHSLSQHFDVSLPQTGIRSDTPIHTGAACFRLLTNRRLLDLAERFVGPDVCLSPVGHVRIKLPEDTLAEGTDGLMAKIPWHQDNGVVLQEADDSEVLTVWLPINEATIENGCLQVLPTPRSQALIEHCPTGKGGTHIPDPLIDETRAVALPMRPGSVLLLHPRTVHSSLENTSADQVRISMDLRYQPVGQPTGRPMFPEFVVRSRSHPDQVVGDPATWSRRWLEARARLAEDRPSSFNRWDPNSPLCA
ncbi:MAG: phytanoyl-CoA dioxygenase family protein [Candidatus Dormiibacterota bacterium]